MNKLFHNQFIAIVSAFFFKMILNCLILIIGNLSQKK